jgi:hypothetical protein
MKTLFLTLLFCLLACTTVAAQNQTPETPNAALFGTVTPGNNGGSFVGQVWGGGAGVTLTDRHFAFQLDGELQHAAKSNTGTNFNVGLHGTARRYISQHFFGALGFDYYDQTGLKSALLPRAGAGVGGKQARFGVAWLFQNRLSVNHEHGVEADFYYAPKPSGLFTEIFVDYIKFQSFCSRGDAGVCRKMSGWSPTFRVGYRWGLKTK